MKKIDLQDDDPRLYEVGFLCAHSSDEDGCADVGLSVGLGGAMLFAGEVPEKPDWSLAIYPETAGSNRVDEPEAMVRMVAATIDRLTAEITALRADLDRSIAERDEFREIVNDFRSMRAAADSGTKVKRRTRAQAAFARVLEERDALRARAEKAEAALAAERESGDRLAEALTTLLFASDAYRNAPAITGPESAKTRITIGRNWQEAVETAHAALAARREEGSDG